MPLDLRNGEPQTVIRPSVIGGVFSADWTQNEFDMPPSDRKGFVQPAQIARRHILARIWVIGVEEQYGVIDTFAKSATQSVCHWPVSSAALGRTLVAFPDPSV